MIVESYGASLDASSAVYGGGYLRSTTEGNPQIKPEKKTEYEAGADLRFFNNKVSLSGTYYTNKTTGAIFPVQVPASTGFLNRNDNAGVISNKGVEADLGITWYKSANGKLSISSNLTWSNNKNKVVSLQGTQEIGLAGFASVISAAIPGHALVHSGEQGMHSTGKAAICLTPMDSPLWLRTHLSWAIPIPIGSEA